MSGLLASCAHRPVVERLTDRSLRKTVRSEIEAEAGDDSAYLELVWAV